LTAAASTAIAAAKHFAPAPALCADAAASTLLRRAHCSRASANRAAEPTQSHYKSLIDKQIQIL
jgi:hypothetical protein